MLRVLHSSADREPRPIGRRTVDFDEGFYEEERDDLETFRWMASRGRLVLPPSDGADRFLELWLWSPYYDLSQRLEVALGEQCESFELPSGWGRISIRVPESVREAALHADPAMPASLHPNDSRTLTIQVRPSFVHTDEARHRAIALQHENAVLNQKEMLAGATALESRPTSLGIDIYGACNVKPPCVYCEWDQAKDLEGEEVDRPFTLETLDEYGAFFDSARNLVNCSIGEPFMMKEFEDLLDRFGDVGKNLELSTNGQILTDRNIDRLLGRPIDLYISLDAATPETYAKLRNDTLEKIIANLHRLLKARQGYGAYPRVNLIFMPMKVNLHELEEFALLCADVGVDRMVLRPLNWADTSELDWERSGYHFVYSQELLPFDELIRASGRAAAVCARLGVPLSDQLDFGGTTRETFEQLWNEGWAEGMAWEHPNASERVASDGKNPEVDSGIGKLEAGQTAAPSDAAGTADVAGFPLAGGNASTLGRDKVPICTEPWKNFYILRRGVLPCCYGGAPIAPVDGFREAWNSSKLQAIREALSAGRFHRYCLDSPSCPLVRKGEQAGSLNWRNLALIRARRAWVGFDRALGGIPGFFYRPVKHAILRRLVER